MAGDVGGSIGFNWFVCGVVFLGWVSESIAFLGVASLGWLATPWEKTREVSLIDEDNMGGIVG